MWVLFQAMSCMHVKQIFIIHALLLSLCLTILHVKMTPIILPLIIPDLPTAAVYLQLLSSYAAVAAVGAVCFPEIERADSIKSASW